MKLFDRNRLFEEVRKSGSWDAVIIGGGATGLGLAVDAANRGYKTLLAEQEDFAKGTSSRSTKLIHGGVRYLAQGNIALVKEALQERGLLLQNASHITRNESFIIPCYSWISGLFFALGLKIYDFLSGHLSLGKSEFISRKAVMRRLPGIQAKGLRCGVLYHDGAFDDARLALNLAQTSIEQGAVALNYTEVTGLTKRSDGSLNGVTLTDKETGTVYEVAASVVINATGVFVDDILKLDNPKARALIRPSQGIHVVLDRSFLDGTDAVMIPRTDDGRVLFVIPWQGKVLAGTTDTPLDQHTLEPQALEEEVTFVLKTAGRYLSKQPQRSDVLSVFAGLRPLAATGGYTKKTREISRSHQVIVSPSGLVSVIGGKWTTYRKMAEDTLSKVIQKKMLPVRVCNTRSLKIHGSDGRSHEGVFSEYGADAPELEKLAALLDADRRLVPGDGICVAQVIWGVRNEMARTVEDILARRTRILFLDVEKALRLAPAVASIMMDELGRDEAWKAQQIAAFTDLAQRYKLPGSPRAD